MLIQRRRFDSRCRPFGGLDKPSAGILQGQAFYGLWQQLSNVSNGIKAHQPGWFTGPSYVRMKRLASEINRSHVCD